MLWIGTHGGISVFNGTQFKNYTTADGLAGNVVYKIIQLKDGKIWIATDLGVSVFDGNKFTGFTMQSGLPAEKITDVFEDYKGNKWFTTYGGGLSELNETQFKTLSVVEGLPSNRYRSL